jgi:hypothetical protein
MVLPPLRLIIARRFNAGLSMIRQNKSRQGRKRRVLLAEVVNPVVLSSLAGLVLGWIVYPSVETLGYCHRIQPMLNATANWA